ncbi:DUF2924 domain-containing protein [Rhizobium sp. FKL33]|uniref:DUF2924 domain-containing protein n=1 Tax=Rhizobium sp. FKL33 TaxID=2562307 RepID=UPI00197EBF7D|nr:DUF2924 domain-containing protein [Rhizobium sp. FKL33]
MAKRKPMLEHQLQALDRLSRADLIDLWRKRYGAPPPSGVRQPLLIRSAAWRIQEDMLGGLSVSATRLLKAAIRAAEAKLAARPAAASVAVTSPEPEDGASAVLVSDSSERPPHIRSIPVPGARLIREWNGKRYVVDVLPEGYLLDGTIHRSLTAIAYAITGAKWSGPRFFGL